MASRRRQPKPENVAKGPALNHNVAIELRYTTELQRMVRLMTETTQRELLALFSTEHAQAQIAQDASISHTAKVLMSALQKRFVALFTKNARALASQMLESVNKESAINVTRSLKEVSGDVTISSANTRKNFGHSCPNKINTSFIITIILSYHRIE